MSEPQDALRKGARLNWYEIRNVLGHGGFGITYAAVDVNLNHPVAVKEYFPRGQARRERDGTVRPFENEEAQTAYRWGLERFVREARTLAQLRHPNLVRVVSVFEDSGTAYMVMELEHGQSLQQLIDEHRIRDEAMLLTLMLPVLDGVEYIHENGFIHRDIKPANIIVRPDNTAVLLDFGSARQTRGDSDSQHLTSVVSRGYAPFEQYESGGDENHQGPWTDIYGFGATLYAVITGRSPIDAMSRGTRLLAGSADPLGTPRPRDGTTFGVPLVKAIESALAFQVEDRPQNVAEWRRRLPSSPQEGGVLAPPMPVADTPTAAVDAPTEPRASDKLAKLRVMVVDDESFARNLTRRVLNSIGVDDVTLAENGEHALALLDAEDTLQPDIILTDLRMPGMDGIELLRHLGERSVESGVALMSAANQRILTTTESLARSHRLNILGTLPKPVKRDPLVDLLASFDPGSTSSAQATWIEQIEEDELVAGLETDALHVVYQPKVCVSARRVVGVEALARWKHPERGILGPGAFIGLAESRGHIDRLTERVFSKAMAQAGQWRADGVELQVSVNFSVDTLNRYDLPSMVINEAAANGMDASQVILEVTESRMMRDVRTPLEILTRLNLNGVGLSIDDFGTGHSSLEQIRRIPFTELKIDRAFVTGAVNDPAARAILESSVALAKSLQLHVVAEGVETQEDWDIVAGLECDTVQGYFASRPIEGDDIPAFIETWEAG